MTVAVWLQPTERNGQNNVFVAERRLTPRIRGARPPRASQTGAEQGASFVPPTKYDNTLTDPFPIN